MQILRKLIFRSSDLKLVPHYFYKIGFITTFLLYTGTGFAQTFSYEQAEQYILQNSYSSQASMALQQASQLEAEATKGLGLPRIDLNVRAYTFHNEIDLPLKSVKNNLEQTLSQGVNERIDQWQGENGLPTDITDPLRNGIGQVIHGGIGLIPDTANVVLEDEVVRPTISLMVPLYTGGLTQSAKQIANIQAQRSQLDSRQQQDIQRFEIIQAYFNTQLQQELNGISRTNRDAMQNHYNNALKLERAGFISKGQRMQFEVARNNAERALQNSQANLEASRFQLQNLLKQQTVDSLSTPLFINSQQSPVLAQLMATYPEQSTLIRKMQTDTLLAEENVRAQNAAKKPSIFAFGEYSLDEQQNWIIGMAARYNLFSGIDKQKKVQAAELQRYAAGLATERTKQEIENILFKSYSELTSAQNSHRLLQQNMRAAQENLRIQELSFKEDMGTATQVIDAQNSLNILKGEMALNAYKYIISLASLLQGHGSIEQFKSYIHQPDTVYIR